MYIMCIYIDVSCTNIIYKHIHIMVVNGILFFMACIFVIACHERNTIYDSMTQKKKLKLNLKKLYDDMAPCYEKI
jgi:hypothetical protein